MNQDESDRPSEVGRAVTLLYITLGFGVLRGITAEPNDCYKIPFVFTLFVTFVVNGISWFIFYMIGKGKDWARISFVAFLGIFGIPFAVLLLLRHPFSPYGGFPIYPLLCIGQSIIQIFAAVLLFQKPSNEWFKEMIVRK
jgi:hypothetical protein